MSDWQSLTVQELKEECRNRGLPTSGKKIELVSRLQESDTISDVINAEMIEDDCSETSKFGIDQIKKLPVSVLAVISILLIGTMGGVVIYGDDLIDWVQGEPDYNLIDFDSTSARGYAQSLVDLGHPEWEGRMSGTIEEHNTADFIKANFTSMGIPSTLEDFDVPMFVIDQNPELSICHAGDIGQTFPAFACGPTDVNAEFINFEHRSDFVLQGYSGSAFIRFVDDVDVVDLGTGNNTADWASAAGAVVLIHMTSETESNTELFKRASENDIGGYREAIASITGRSVFARLKFESGVHRVQRVPTTESGGRIHTSAATVAVLPEAEEVDINIANNINIFFIYKFIVFLLKLLLLNLKTHKKLYHLHFLKFLFFLFWLDLECLPL